MKNEKNFFLASSDNLILNLYIGSNLLAIKKLEKKILMSQERLKKLEGGRARGDLGLLSFF